LSATHALKVTVWEQAGIDVEIAGAAVGFHQAEFECLALPGKSSGHGSDV
jgi:hypothetical protein